MVDCTVHCSYKKKKKHYKYEVSKCKGEIGEIFFKTLIKTEECVFAYLS